MKKAKKIILRVIKYVAIGAFLAVVLAAGLLVYVKYLVKDIPTFDDSLMDINRVEVPEEQNAYPLLVRAEIPINDNERFKELESLAKEIDEKGKLSKESAERAKFRYKEQFAMMDRAAGLPYSQAPLPERFDWPIPSYLSTVFLPKIRLAIVVADFEKGRTEGAMETIKSTFEVGRIVGTEQGGSTIIGVAVGLAVKQNALNALNQMLSLGYLPGDGGAELIDFLAKQRTEPEAWRNMIRAEYLWNCFILNDHPARRIFNELMYAGNQPTESILWIFFKHSFKRERTRKLVYDYNATFFNNADKMYSEMTFEEPPYLKYIYTPSIEALTLFLKGEYGASAYAAIMTPNVKNLFARKCQIEFFVDGTRLRIATLAFKQDNGKFPQTLGELAPEYIKEIPRDPFDGKPVRYDRERKIIYSVGKDLVDDGGEAEIFIGSGLKSPGKPTLDEKDYVIKIEQD